LEFYELGDWDACDTADRADGLNQAQLLRCYAEAVIWAEDVLQAAA
jgi:hypothetical protein